MRIVEQNGQDNKELQGPLSKGLAPSRIGSTKAQGEGNDKENCLKSKTNERNEKKKTKNCVERESNPHRLDGNQSFYR